MKLSDVVLAAAAWGAIVAPAHAATTLDFDDFAFAGTGQRYIQEASFDYKGFRFTSSYGVNPNFLYFGASDPRNGDPAGSVMAHRWDSFPLVVSRIDGAVFDLVSLDVGDILNAGARHTNTFQFQYASGAPTDAFTFTTDDAVGLQTLALNKTGLRSFQFTAHSLQWWQFDNIVVSDTPGPEVAGVPEPATWAMLILGFFAGGASLRAQRRRLASI